MERFLQLKASNCSRFGTPSGRLVAKLGNLGENCVKWHSTKHSLCQDASFEILHAKIDLGSFWGKMGKFRWVLRQNWGVWEKLGQRTLTTAFIAPWRAVWGTICKIGFGSICRCFGGKLGDFKAVLKQNWDVLGHNWVKQHSLRHSFEILHAKIHLVSFCCKLRDFRGVWAKNVGAWGLSGQMTLSMAFLVPRRIVWGTTC